MQKRGRVTKDVVKRAVAIGMAVLMACEVPQTVWAENTDVQEIAQESIRDEQNAKTEADAAEYEELTESVSENEIVSVNEVVSSLDGTEDALGRTIPGNPSYDSSTDTANYDCVYFGSYPQTEVTGADLTDAIIDADYNADNDYSAWVGGTKYRRLSKDMATCLGGSGGWFNWSDGGYHYFKYESIKWRVLKNDGRNLSLVAETALDAKKYNDTCTLVTWETCTMRSYLNNTFFNRAFSNEEQAAVCQVTIGNEDNPYYGTEGGNATSDKVYLLSYADVVNSDYGFCPAYSTDSKSRYTKSTDYAKAMGTWQNTSEPYTGNCWWWLRSPGGNSYNAMYVSDCGYVYRDGDYVINYGLSVRPALSLPLSSSLWSDAPGSGGGGGTPTNPPETIDNNITINQRGKAYPKLLLKDNSGAVRANQKVSYTYENFSDTFEATSDGSGFIRLETPTLHNTSGSEDERLLIATVTLVNSGGNEVLSSKKKIVVKTIPLSYSQKWDMISTTTITPEAGLKIGAAAGPADVTASLGEISASASGGGKLTMENIYNSGVRTLKLNQTYNSKIAAKAKAGLAGEANAIVPAIDFSACEVYGSASAGVNVSTGLEIADYSPGSLNDNMKVGKYLIGVMGNASGNAMLVKLAELMGFDYANTKAMSEVLELKRGVDAGSLNAGGKSVGKLGSIEMTTTHSYTKSKNAQKEISSKYSLEENLKTDILASDIVVKANALETDLKSGINVTSTKKSNGEIKDLKIDGTTEAKKGVLLTSNVTTKHSEYTFDKANAQSLYDKNVSLKAFSDGSIHYFFGDSKASILNSIDHAGVSGTYIDSIEKQKIQEVDVPFEAVALIGVKGDLKLSGISEYKYETGRGSYINGTRERTSSSDIAAEVEENKLTPVDIFVAPLAAAKDAVLNMISDIPGHIVDGVASAGAAIGGAVNSAKDWLVHIVRIPGFSGLSQTSYCISTYSDESAVGSETTVASTVGEPYLIYVTDSNDEEIMDYSEEPLTLSLSYNAIELSAAGATEADVSNLAVYQYSEEACGYIYCGGEVDTENQCVTLSITKPGQYILAIDTTIPVISEMQLSDKTNQPVFTASIGELSGFSKFSMKVDGTEVINSSNLVNYYNAYTGILRYSFSKALSEGKHEITIIGTDGAGNTMTEPAAFTFVVDTVAPVIEKTRSIVTNGKVKIYATVSGDDVASVKAVVTSKDSSGKTANADCTLEKEGSQYVGSHILTGSETEASFVVEAIDTNENRAVSESQMINLSAYNELLGKTDADKKAGGADKNGYLTATLNKTGFVYTGDVIHPQIKAFYHYTSYGNTADRDGKKAKIRLVENRDYTVSYSDDISVGTCTMTLTGMGDYTGEYSMTYSITPKNIKNVVLEPLADIKSAGEGVDMTDAIKAQVQLTDGVHTLDSSDYDVSFKVDGVSRAAVTGAKDKDQIIEVLATGKNNYSGSLKKTQKFLLLAAESEKLSVSGLSITLKQPAKKYSYTGKAIKPAVVVKDGNEKKLAAANYKLVYQNNVNSGTATVMLVGRKNYYGTAQLMFPIEKKDLSKVKVNALSKLSFTNTAESIRPVVMNGKTYLKEGTDYTTDTAGVKDVSLGALKLRKVTLKLNAVSDGNYTGSRDVSCTIIPRSLNNLLCVKAYCADTVLSNGKAEPKPVIYYNGELLHEGTDYTIVSYKKNTKPGKATVTVKGMGNYSGKRIIKFHIGN